MQLSLGQHLQQRQVQQLKLAPKMILSQEILQLPLMRLEERVKQELEENPVLAEELDIQDEDTSEAVPPEVESTEATPSEEATTPEVSAPSGTEGSEAASAENSSDPPTTEEYQELQESIFEQMAEFNDDFEERPRVSQNRIEEVAQRDHDLMANAPARGQSLQEHLLEQLSYYDLDPQVRELAQRIISSLDHRGWLSIPLEDLIPVDLGPKGLELAEQALRVVQSLDPPGVGARGLQECLLLQLTPDLPHYELLRTIIAEHFDDVLHNRLPQIARKTGYSLEQIQQAVQQLKKLNFHPGAEFEHAPALPVTPELYVEEDANGRYRVRLADERLPRLYIRPMYRQMLRNGTADEQLKQYIRSKINSAEWLIQAIEKRRDTLLKVAQAIVDHQQDFFKKGPEFIHPLKMQQIADRVGVDVTTVSRAVSGKWIQTPVGLFPLKRFFVGGLSTQGGEEVAPDAVRIKLKEIIDQEDKANPLSDDELVRELAKHGFKVARRTVTKYRKALNIPSSRQRRDWTLVRKRQSGSPPSAPDAS